MKFVKYEKKFSVERIQLDHGFCGIKATTWYHLLPYHLLWDTDNVGKFGAWIYIENNAAQSLHRASERTQKFLDEKLEECRNSQKTNVETVP
jgi:hypothetical protein